MRATALLFALALAGGCQSRTEVRIYLAVEGGAPVPSAVTMNVYDSFGVIAAHAGLDGAKLPGAVMVLVSPDAARVRAYAFGRTDDGQLVQAVGATDVTAGVESGFELLLSTSPVADLDGDGVPDEIDNCPTVANSDQSAVDGAPDGDACAVVSPDLGAGDAAPAAGGGSDGGGVTPASCGDGKIDPGEQCDDGAGNSDSPASAARCTSRCRLRAACGQVTGALGASVDPATGHCYVAWGAPLDWASAERDCQSRGGDLVSITSQGENDRVRTLVGATTAWIGLTTPPAQAVATQSWKWVTGEPVSYNGFAPSQPNDGGSGEDCGQIASDGWHDYACGWASTGNLPLSSELTFPYVCETGCGNGVVEPGEQCDPPGASCTATCQSRAACTEAGAISSTVNGHCYFALASAYSYASALAACPAGTHLATLNEPVESEAALKAIASDSWIALSAMSVPGDFSWDVGTEVFDPQRYHGFTGATDPNQAAPACAVVTNVPPSGNPGWRDRGCTTDVYPPLCERD
ncbi:MAG TPA: lectin-like protein [Polyangia bacterium]